VVVETVAKADATSSIGVPKGDEVARLAVNEVDAANAAFPLGQSIQSGAMEACAGAIAAPSSGQPSSCSVGIGNVACVDDIGPLTAELAFPSADVAIAGGLAPLPAAAVAAAPVPDADTDVFIPMSDNVCAAVAMPEHEAEHDSTKLWRSQRVAERELDAAAFSGDVLRLQSAISAAEVAGVTGSGLEVARQVLARDLIRVDAEHALEDALRSGDADRLGDSLVSARSHGVALAKIRAAEIALQSAMAKIEKGSLCGESGANFGAPRLCEGSAHACVNRPLGPPPLSRRPAPLACRPSLIPLDAVGSSVVT